MAQAEGSFEREDSPDWLHEYKAPVSVAFDPLLESSPSSSPSPSKKIESSELDDWQNGTSSSGDKLEAIGNAQSADLERNDSDGEVPLKQFISGSKSVTGKGLSAGSPGNLSKVFKKPGRKRKSESAPADYSSDEASPMKVVKSKNKRVEQETMVVHDEEDDVNPSFKSKRRQSKGFGIEGEKDSSTPKKSTPKKVGKGRLQKETELLVIGASPEDVAGFAGGDSKLTGADAEYDLLVKTESGDTALADFADGETFLTQDLQTEEAEGEDEVAEMQERRVKSRAASTLPLVFAEKVYRTKVLLECEGDTLDLSGDMGAVGRFSVSNESDPELLLDLKGVIYKTTIVPSNTFFVVNVGQAEAKVEAIMNDFVQLRADTDCNENETMVEGTLEGFTYDSDEGERPAGVGVDKVATAGQDEPQESEGDTKVTKTKTPAKGPKVSKGPAKKVVAGKPKGGRGKASGKGGAAKKATSKRPTKSKATAAKKTNSRA